MEISLGGIRYVEFLSHDSMSDSPRYRHSNVLVTCTTNLERLDLRIYPRKSCYITILRRSFVAPPQLLPFEAFRELERAVEELLSMIDLLLDPVLARIDRSVRQGLGGAAAEL